MIPRYWRRACIPCVRMKPGVQVPSPPPSQHTKSVWASVGERRKRWASLERGDEVRELADRLRCEGVADLRAPAAACARARRARSTFRCSLTVGWLTPKMSANSHAHVSGSSARSSAIPSRTGCPSALRRRAGPSCIAPSIYVSFLYIRLYRWLRWFAELRRLMNTPDGRREARSRGRLHPRRPHVLYEQRLRVDPASPLGGARPLPALQGARADGVLRRARAEGVPSRRRSCTRFLGWDGRPRRPPDHDAGARRRGLDRLARPRAPMAVGVAYALRAKGLLEQRVVVLTGDAELNEGSNWEAILHARRHAARQPDARRRGQRSTR